MTGTVRPAQFDDADRIAEIRVAGWRTTYREWFDPEVIDHPDFLDASRDTWRAVLGFPAAAIPEHHRGGETLVFVDATGRVAGWASVGPDRAPDPDCPAPTRGELWGLYLDPSAWGTGAADVLLDAATRHLAARGHRVLTLWTLAGNTRAQAFYRRAGWAPTGRSLEVDFGPPGRATEIEFTRAVDAPAP